MTIFVFKCQYMWLSNSLLRKYNQFVNLTLSFVLFWSLKKSVNHQLVCMVTYVTGCYSLTLPLSERLHETNYIRFIYHLKGVQKGFNETSGQWKTVTYNTSRVTIFVIKCQYLWPSNSWLRRYNKYRYITWSFLKRMLIIKYFVG